MRANWRAAFGRATAYQTGRVTRANQVEVGDVVYYFSPRVTRDDDNRISKKLALLWTGPYQVVGKPSESLATLQPMRHWAQSDREPTTMSTSCEWSGVLCPKTGWRHGCKST